MTVLFITVIVLCAIVAGASLFIWLDPESESHIDTDDLPMFLKDQAD